jgi:Sulfotransferase family
MYQAQEMTHLPLMFKDGVLTSKAVQLRPNQRPQRLAFIIVSLILSFLFLRENLQLVKLGLGGNAGKGRPKQLESAAREIVERAYQETYKQIVDRCQDKTPLSLMKCLQEIHKEATIHPWWFQTLLRDAASIDAGLHGPWHNVMLQAPSSQHVVEYCAVEKVASSHFKALNCHLQGKPIIDETCVEYIEAMPTSHAVFLRDPLERFLSGFVDKCISPYRETELHCEPSPIFSPEEGRLERLMGERGPAPLVEELMRDRKVFLEAFVDTFPLKWNLHFFPTSLYCNGLYNTLEDYDFVGHMDERFYDDLQDFGKRYNMEANVAKVFELPVTPNGDVEKQNQLERTRQKVRKYFTPRSLRRLLEYLSIDYSVHGLNLPIPAWVDEMLAEEAER